MSKHATRHSAIDSAAWAAWTKQEHWYIGMSPKDIFKHAFRTGWRAAKASALRKKHRGDIQRGKI